MHYNLELFFFQVNILYTCKRKYLHLITYGELTKPATEATWIIAPPPLFAICKIATLVPLITAVVFTSIIFSSKSSSISEKVELALCTIPALSTANFVHVNFFYVIYLFYIFLYIHQHHQIHSRLI